MEEWCHLFNGLSLKLNQTPVIWCDNQQTVGIVTKEQDKLSTKLKLVEIHILRSTTCAKPYYSAWRVASGGAVAASNERGLDMRRGQRNLVECKVEI
jgi:hypothetical protein